MEEDSTCFSTYRALQIPCILQQVFRYLPHQDLKRVRLVNRVFNEESSRIHRKRSKIVLNSPKRLIAFYLEKFTDVHSFCEGFQLVNVHVATPSMQIFLESCGKSIKSLDLRDSKWTFAELKEILLRASSQLEEVVIHGLLPKELWSSSPSLPPTPPGIVTIRPYPIPAPVAPPRSFEEGLGQMLLLQPRAHSSNLNKDNNNQAKHALPNKLSSSNSLGFDDEKKRHEVLWLPKVRRLDLQLYDKLPEDDCLQDFIIKILNSTINLEILRSSESRKGKSRREKFHRILFETLIDSKFNVSLPNLSKIDFSLTPWGDDQYLRLSSKNFPLTYLSLTILPDISTFTVVKLLGSFKTTLTKLKISFTNWQIMEFPSDLGLNKLRHLNLDWYNGSLKFVTYLKNLETLILAQVDLNEALRDEIDKDDLEDEFDENDENAMKYQQRRHPMLSSFELYQPAGAEIFPESVRKLSGIFPNLKKLVLGKLTNQSLRAVFTVYPALEEFSAIEGVYSDEGVTGISVQPCHVCDKQHLTELCRGMYNEILINSQRSHCFIGDMKNLRKLELRAPSLTNLSVYHGILQCKRLRSLTLRSFHLTYRALQRIVDTFSLEYLESTHSFSHAAEIKYALKKMSGRTFILNGMEAPREYCRCTTREIDNFILHFASFINARPVVQIPKNDRRSLRRPMGIMCGSLRSNQR